MGWWVDRYGGGSDKQSPPGESAGGGMSREEWLRFDPVVDERPFLVRVKLGWSGGVKGKPKVEVTGGTDF